MLFRFALVKLATLLRPGQTRYGLPRLLGAFEQNDPLGRYSAKRLVWAALEVHHLGQISRRHNY